VTLKKFTHFILVFVCLISFCFAAQSKGPKVIETKVGQNFTITLGSNATTGYQWQFAKPLDESKLQLLSSDYLMNKTDLVGAPGKQAWVFKAIKAGKTTVYFKYVRSWEKNNPPKKEESFVIIIRRV
jgi:inhibitor of cysteine peptidase